MSGLVFAQADWTQRFPAHVPPKRMNPAMAQSSSGLVVMFGGLNLGAEGRFDQFNVLNDTWVWNGTDWSQIALSSSTSPPARWGASMAFDNRTGLVVLFGGRNAARQFL